MLGSRLWATKKPPAKRLPSVFEGGSENYYVVCEIFLSIILGLRLYVLTFSVCFSPLWFHGVHVFSLRIHRGNPVPLSESGKHTATTSSGFSHYSIRRGGAARIYVAQAHSLSACYSLYRCWLRLQRMGRFLLKATASDIARGQWGIVALRCRTPLSDNSDNNQNAALYSCCGSLDLWFSGSLVLWFVLCCPSRLFLLTQTGCDWLCSSFRMASAERARSKPRNQTKTLGGSEQSALQAHRESANQRSRNRQ